MKNKLILIFTSLLFLTSIPNIASAQRKKVFVIPENAKIFYNGQEVGNGSYDIKFSRNEDFVILKFEATGYITKTVKLFKNNPNKTVSYTLSEDEAMLSSVGGDEDVDVANKTFTITCKDGMDQDIVWKRLMNIAIRYFENVEVRDKSAGWIKTGWNRTSFAYQVVRTRLEIRLAFTDSDKLSYDVKLSSEIADKDCGTSDQCFSKYDRILKKYEQLISEIQTSLGSNF